MFKFTRFSLLVGIVVLALIFPISAAASGNQPGYPGYPGYPNGGNWGCNCPPYYQVYPTFFIRSVVRNGTVTVITHNLPASDTFRVQMGPMGTLGIHGIPVATFDTGVGGTQTLTFDIPPAFYGASQISIRMQSITGSGFYAFNWFWNNTAY